MFLCVYVSLVQDFVISRSSGTFYWIGLTDGRTGNWEWVNQTPYVMNRRWAEHLAYFRNMRIFFQNGDISEIENEKYLTFNF